MTMPSPTAARLPALTLLLCSAFLLPSPVLAQETAVKESKDTKGTNAPKDTSSTPAATPRPVEPPARGSLQQVEVKASANQYDARRHDTATKIVVTQEEILKFGDTSVSEVLKRLPGVTTGGGLRMRGLGGGYTQILVNGEPAPPGFSLDALSPDMIERIEIMRAGTAEYSMQAIAGTINIILRRTVVTAQREIRPAVADNGGYPSASIGFQVSDKRGDFSYAVNGGSYAGRYGGGSWVEEYASDAAARPTRLRFSPQRFGGGYRGLNLGPRLNWSLGADTISSQSYLNINRSLGHYASYDEVKLGAPPLFTRARYDSESTTINAGSNLNWLRKLDGGGKLDAKLGLNYNSREFANGGQQFDPRGALALQSQATTDALDYGLTASGKLSYPLIDGHAIVFGWDGAFTRRDDDLRRDEASPTGLVPENYLQRLSADVRRLALFGQDEWSVTPQWSVYAGLRWEGIRTRASAQGVGSSTNNAGVWSPVLQTLYRIPGSRADQLRAAVTRSYKAPGTMQLVPRYFNSRENSVTSADYRGNPDLRPELAWGLDLSYEHFIEGGGVISVSAYGRRIDDLIRQRVLLLGERWTMMTTNVGSATAMGLEMDARLPLRALWAEAPAVDLRANLTRSWSHVDDVPGPNNRLDAQIPFSANLGADYKMAANGPLSLGGNFTYQGGGPMRTSVTQESWSAPRRTLDVYAAWKFDNKHTLRLSVGNVLHQDVLTASRYADAAGETGTRTRALSSANVRLSGEIKL